MIRRESKAVKVGPLVIGGGAEISVQSMLDTRSDDVAGSVRQAEELVKAGCQVVRAAVPDMQGVHTLGAVIEAVGGRAAVVADIHFDYKLALESIAAGVDKVRINPGNIGAEDRVKAVVRAATAAGVPIRIGVNGGSLEKEILKKHGSPTAQALAESAFYHARLLEKFDFTDIILSVKSSDVVTTIESYRLLAAQCNYPLHLGVTETGTARMGLVKSSIGIGSLLADGIGDTLRVSLTASVLEEVSAGQEILAALGLLRNRPRLVSCPTCGRTRVDLIGLANEMEKRLQQIEGKISVAVMGCAVNGPGEAREADIGVACGEDCGLLFRKGEIVRKVPQKEIPDALMQLCNEVLAERKE